MEDFIFNKIGNFLLKLDCYLLLIFKLIKTIPIKFIITLSLKEILTLRSTVTNKQFCIVCTFYGIIYYLIIYVSARA
jgi:hypothetical protein